MYLIAGLGNPGKKYERTKHNVGFDTIDVLVERFNIPCGGTAREAMYGKGVIGGEKAMLIKPLTFMNLSGNAIRSYTDYYGIDVANEVIVIYDDVDLPKGTVRIRKRGSAGSHNGMKSVVSSLGSGDFTRVRIGIGPKPEHSDMIDYVLRRFKRDDRKLIDEAIELAADAVEMIIKENVESAMNKFNQKNGKTG